MIIDADTHISQTEPQGVSFETLLRSMDAAGIDKAVVWLAPPYMRKIREANRYVHEAAKRHPDRFIPFGWADIHLGMRECADQITQCLEEFGMYGVKFNGAQNDYPIDSAEVFELCGRVAEAGRVVAFHVGADFYHNTHPYQAAKLARAFPQTPFLFSHMGGAGVPDLSGACIEFAGELDNITLIGSNAAYTQVLKAVRTLGARRVCFGSDAPFFMQRVELAAYRALMEEGGLSPAERDDILGGNIRRLIPQ